MTEAQVLRVNGWSNMYWGWGGEDDDMWKRIAQANMAVWRYPPPFVKYNMIKHKPQVPNKDRLNLLQHSNERTEIDGLNSVRYSVNKTTRYPLYTHILADISANYNLTNLPGAANSTQRSPPSTTTT
nr:beta-1,4-galactosyltransferase 2-like [Procambarus clarkii]